MHLNEKKINLLFFYWLLFSLIFIFVLIVVGGLTRLTNSGLSIIEWELFTGILPPLNNETWDLYFSKYKTIPQYKLLNFNMTLDEFKIIFYWEYFHRILARFIGLFFLIPLIFFYFSKKIDKKYIYTCLITFILIITQGVIGWYMVKSGLVNNISVSHYRLSIHLTIAILIISIIFWNLRDLAGEKKKIFFRFSKDYFPFQFLLLIIFLQIIVGAFVSGLDAGKIYQTWPLMGESYIPNDITLKNQYIFFDFNNHSLVQFYHRNLAYFIIIYILYLSLKIFKRKKTTLYAPIKILIGIMLLQIILGIFTLLSGLNLYLASTHQITGVLLVLSALNLYYFNAK